MIVLMIIIDFLMVPVLGIVIDSEYSKEKIMLEKKLLVKYLGFLIFNIPLTFLFSYMHQCLSGNPIDIVSGSFSVCAVIGIVLVAYAYAAFKKRIFKIVDKYNSLLKEFVITKKN